MKKKNCTPQEFNSADLLNTTPMNTAPKPSSPWTTVNILIAVGCFIGCCWFVSAIGVEMILVVLMVILNIVLLIFTGINEKTKLFGKLLKGLRIAAFSLLAVMVLAPAIPMNFNHTKAMYPLKKFIYSGESFYVYLPESLPEKCENYKFVTQSQVPAQDHHASSYLIFYTDQATIAEYEKYYQEIGYKLNEPTPMTPEEIEEEKSYNENFDGYYVQRQYSLPTHVYTQVEDHIKGDYVSPKLYQNSSYYPKGCFLDSGTGLVIIWT